MQKATFTDINNEKEFFRRIWNFRVNYRLQPSFYDNETFFKTAVKEICDIETKFQKPFYLDMLVALVSDLERTFGGTHDKT